MAKTQVSSTRIYQFVFGLLFLIISFGAVQSMMYGFTQNVKLVAFLATAFAVVMWLDSLYWLVLPLCMALGVHIPGLPFNSTELGCLAFAGVHLFRISIKRDPQTPWNKTILSAVPLMAWICLFWILNPAGMNIMRSFGIGETQSVGGRFYLKIAFSFVALCCLSTIRLRERDCKFLFRVIVCGALMSIALTILGPGLADIGTDESESASRYYLLPFASLYCILWAKYSITDIIFSLRIAPILFISAVATILSGKRSMAASLALIPVYRVLLTRKHRWLTLGIGLMAFVLLAFAVSFDEEGGFELPRSVRRPLAMVFPKYREKGLEGLHDTFRTEVHAYAKELIRQHPWVGRRGFRMDMDTMLGFLYTRSRDQFEGHAFAGNWHGAFWAYAADFGIPCLIFYLLLVGKGLRFAFRYAPLFPEGSFRSACFLYYAMMFLHSAVIMSASGHSSLTTEQAFLRLGMMVAIMNGIDSERVGQPIQGQVDTMPRNAPTM